MTRADAQLLYDWLIARFGNPERSKMAAPALVNSPLNPFFPTALAKVDAHDRCRQRCTK